MTEALVFFLVVVGVVVWITLALLKRHGRKHPPVGLYEAAYLASPQRQRLAEAPHGFQPSTYMPPPPPPATPGGIGTPGRHAAPPPGNFVVGPCRHSLTRDEARELFNRLSDYLIR